MKQQFLQHILHLQEVLKDRSRSNSKTGIRILKDKRQSKRLLFYGQKKTSFLKNVKNEVFIGQPGFEPGTPSPPDLYANQLRYCPSLHAFRRQPKYDSKTVKKSQRSCMACIRHHAHRQVRKRRGHHAYCQHSAASNRHPQRKPSATSAVRSAHLYTG